MPSLDSLRCSRKEKPASVGAASSPSAVGGWTKAWSDSAALTFHIRRELRLHDALAAGHVRIRKKGVTWWSRARYSGLRDQEKENKYGALDGTADRGLDGSSLSSTE